MQDTPEPVEDDSEDAPVLRPIPPIAVHGCGIHRPWDY
jgi:hypothetical protein